MRSNSDHESKFPVELPRRVIKLFTAPDDIVLDCFIGSGTTAIAAASEGRKFIGIDKEEKSVLTAKQAIKSLVSASYDEYQIKFNTEEAGRLTV